jgi:hypothetical protein
MVAAERLPVERVRQQGVRFHAFSSVMLRANCCWTFSVFLAEDDVLVALVGTEEDDLAGFVVHTDAPQHVAQPHAGEPAVGQEVLLRPGAVSGALVAVDDVDRWPWTADSASDSSAGLLTRPVNLSRYALPSMPGLL